MEDIALAFIFVIYGVNRKDKSYTIRKILYAPNDKILDKTVKVTQSKKSKLSCFFIQ